MAQKKNTVVYVAALVLFLGGVGTMAWSALSEGSAYFINVSEALAMPAENLNSARLFGTVARGDIALSDDSLGVRFYLQDAERADQVILVTYRGVVPDTFEAGAEVIVEGAMRDGTFDAKVLMTKCPSKYQKENRGTSRA